MRQSQQQNGHFYIKSKRWKVRFYDDVIQSDGTVKRKQLSRDLCPVDDAHRNMKSVRPLAAEILQPLNSGKLDVRSTMSVADFIRTVYLPEVDETRRASTAHDYWDIFEIHLEGRLEKTKISLRDFRTCDAEELLKTIARQAKTKHGAPLRHTTLARIKSFLSGAFTSARRKGVLDSPNPMVGVSVPAGSPAGTTYAYSLPEIWAMLKVREPARTILLTAAFSGLRQGEIRGLRWSDYDGAVLHVRRSVWNKGVINPPKTVSSAAPVPVVKVLADALNRHKERQGKLAAPDFPIFANGVKKPMDLHNLSERVIAPAIEKCSKCGKSKGEHPIEGHVFALDPTLRWCGWHAFRRGLATNLHALGVDDKTIQAILRHSNIGITQNIYVKSVSESQVSALDLLAEKMENEDVCTNHAPISRETVN